MNPPLSLTRKRKPLRIRLRNWLWEIGLIELPFWQQPEIPMLRGEPLRLALELRGLGK